MTTPSPILTVVVPLRCSPDVRHFHDRALLLAQRWHEREDVELFFVDSGSAPEMSAELAQVVASRASDTIRYQYIDTRLETYSIGEARDHGAMHARGQFLMFQDVDLAVSSTFYDDVIREIRRTSMERSLTEFFCVPCLYLTVEGSDEFQSQASLGDERFWRLHLRLMEGDRTHVLNLAPATSTFVVRRHQYLAVGGHRSEFAGHGFEDFELFHRLAAEANKFLRSFDYYIDRETYDSIEYQGFRAFYAMHGYQAFHRGIFTVHLWHPRVQGFYDARRAHNRELLPQIMKAYDEQGTQPNPLPDLSSGRRTLVFGVPGDRAVLAVRQVLPLLGEALYRSPSDFDGPESLFEFVERKGVERIFFFNPYGNERRLAVYRWVRERGFPYLVYERGGLTDSWFFDPGGFNADSSSYAVEQWDHPLSDADAERVDDYMRELLQSDKALEKNNPRVGQRRVREQLRISDRKVLFVPFQRPGDTVTRYFAGPVDGVAGFAELVAQVAAGLDRREWVVVAKKHPLEAEYPACEGVRFVPDDTHFLDLLHLCEAVLVMNSGVGLYSLVVGKPLLYTSETYYGHPGLATQVSSLDDVLRELRAPSAPDPEKVRRFIHHLRYRVYSFGEPRTIREPQPDGSEQTITLGVRFREIRGLDQQEHLFTYRERPIPISSPVYDRFRANINFRQRREMELATRLPERVEPASPPARTNRTFRKLRKLARNPRAFVRDSWMVEMLRRVSTRRSPAADGQSRQTT